MPESSRPSSPSGRRITGVTVPLFSLRSERSWGIGEISDLPPFADWIVTAGIKLVQILPLGEISNNETSPYSALSAFGIDPMYISIADIPEILGRSLRDLLGGEMGVAILEEARASHHVDYGKVRFLKNRALRFAFERFQETEYANDTQRAQDFKAFVSHEQHWLDDYALFRALKDSHRGVAWWDWIASAKNRDYESLNKTRAKLGDEVLYFQFVQWIAHAQWDAARSKLHKRGVEIMGDLPFMVGRDSADVWSHQKEFRLDQNVGVPADQFDPDGQDWGLPPYKWDAMRANDFAWLRRRARYAGELYDRFRIDHLVGFYRTYIRPMKTRDAAGKMVKGVFDPVDERSQLTHGERVINAMVDAARERNARLVAEDLGTVPTFVRTSLSKLGVPGYRVLIWEKDDEVFRDPKSYPEVSLACFGTHDTDPVAVWWETRSAAERAAVLELPGISARAAELSVSFTPVTHRALLDLINGSGSELVLLLIQDVLGTRDRVNTPGTVGPHNWSYRLPGTVVQLADDAGANAAMSRVRESIGKSGR